MYAFGLDAYLTDEKTVFKNSVTVYQVALKNCFSLMENFE